MKIEPVMLTLPGGRARLEPLGHEHAAGLLEAGRDPVVWRWLPLRQPDTLGAISEWIDGALAQRAKGIQMPFAIIDQGENKVAGSTRFLDIQPANRGIEIGWTWIGTPWQRTSINTECKYLLMRHAFEAQGAIRVQLKTDLRNTQSQEAIKRIGAKYEGVLRKSMIMHDGHMRDSVYFSVLVEEWPEVKARLVARLSPGVDAR